MDVLRINGLRKQYAGKQALDGASLTLEQGKIIGLLGPNGSGKTTLMKIVAGLLLADSGEIHYPNAASRGVEAKKVISFLPDEAAFPSWMKVSDAFIYFRDMYGDYDPYRAANMQKFLELPMAMPIKKLSRGMKDRVALALTFSRKAPLYLLDEPLGGIDPVGKTQVLESIISTHGEDSAILLSTHLVKDVEAIFDSIILLKDGKAVFEGGCEAIREESGKTVEQVYLEVFSGV